MTKRHFQSKRSRRLVAAVVLQIVATSILIARPQPVAQVRPVGVIEGVVMQMDNGIGVANAQVTLSGGPIKQQGLSKLSEQLAESTYMPDNVTMIGVRGQYTNNGGMAQPAAQQAAIKAMNEGIKPAPENGAFEDGILQNIMRYSNVNFGTSPFNSEFVSAITNFRAANAQFKATTDRSGRFTLRDVPEGNYTVRVERDGYYGRGGVVPQTASASVTVSSRQIANVTVPMVRGATISGRLRDNDGLPMANATVQAFTVAYSNGLPALRAAASNKTNDRGEYSIFWLPPGEYIIAMVRDSTQVVGGYLLQQVVGTFYPGTAAVTEAIPVTVKGGQNLDGIDFTHRIAKPIRVTGRVVTTLPPPPAPTNAAGAQVNVANQARNAVLMLLLRDPAAPDDIGARTIATVRVDVAKASGDFEVDLTPGAYDLYARMPTPNGTGPVNVSFGRTSFDVREDAVKDLVIKVDPVRPLNGVVTVNGSAPGANNIKISLQVDDSGAKLPAYGIQIRARTIPVDPSGSFVLPAVFVGHWQVFLEGLSPEMYVADVRQGAGSVFDSGITITGEQPSSLQVLIRTDSGTVDGVVVDTARKPVPGASVVIVPSDTRRQNRLLYRTGTAGADGRFSIKGVAPGNYKVFSWPGGDTSLFSAPIDGGYYNPKYLARFESSGHPINVTQAVSNVELTVIPVD